MFDFLKRWRKQRRKEKQLSLKYARQSLSIQRIELDLALTDLALTREMVCRDAEFQKRKGLREYIT